MLFNKVAIIGIGLIGGSLSLAIKNKKIAKHIVGIDLNLNVAKLAYSIGIIDEYCDYDNIGNIINDNNINCIIISVPVGAFGSVLQKISPYINKNTIISDVGSTKNNIIEQAYKFLSLEQISHFIPAHPIAGSHNQGPTAAKENLFSNKTLIITPLENNNKHDIDKIHELWQTCGSNITYMTAQEHDEIFSVVSHMPHILSFSFMDYVINLYNSKQCLDLAGSGFMDFTRIAGSSAELWRDVCLANKTQILHHLSQYIQNLNKFHSLIDQDSEELINILHNASTVRNKLDKI